MRADMIFINFPNGCFIFRHCKDRGLPIMSLLAFLSITIGKTIIRYFDFFAPFFDIFSSSEFVDIRQNITGIRGIQSTLRREMASKYPVVSSK